MRMSFTIAGGRSRLATVTNSPVPGSSVARPHESTPRTPRASSRITRIVRSTSRLAVTARPASRSARVSRARRTLSSKSRALWIAIPACSPNASSTRWWCAVDAHRRAALGGPAHDPFADRDRERAPRLAPHAVGRHVADVGPLRIEEADSAARAADQLADRLADPVEDPRHLEAGADELARRVERRELVLPPVAFREEPSQLDRRRERPAELADDLDVLVVEGSRASRGQRHGAEDATSRQEWHQRHGAVAAL